MARWADVLLIAPCSATTLSKLATGNCDNALLTVAASLPPDTPLVVSPAMDTDMWEQRATQRNIDQVKKDGVIVIEPDEGELASGLQGKGRLPDLDKIVELVSSQVSDVGRQQPSDPTTSDQQPGTRIVITAGPTHEPIDAVRSIMNHSSGRMGFALAEAARDRGMLVTLISGPVHLRTPFGVERIDVTTAAEMHEEVTKNQDADVIIMSAAVADFTPEVVVDEKIKKADNPKGMTIALKPTVDILAQLGSEKRDDQTIVGFALESQDVIAYAKGKLERKKADMIVANKAGVPDSGFGGTSNTISIITPGTPPTNYPAMSKRACAEVIIDHILELRNN